MRRSIFLFFLTLYLATTAGHIYTIDSYLNYSVTKAIGSGGRLSMPRSMMTVEGRGGRNYSKLGIGQSVAGLPLYLAGDAVERAAPGNLVFRAYSGHVTIPYGSRLIRCEPQTLIKISDVDGARVFFTALTNAFVTAAICLLFFMLLGSFGLSARASFLGTLVLGLATPFWIYSRDLFGEPLFTMCLLGAFYVLVRPGGEPTLKQMGIAGFFSSLGILTRVSFAPIVALLAVYVFWAAKDKRRGLNSAVAYALFSLPGLIALGILNWVRFEGIFTSGYHTAFDKGFSLPVIKGVIWNLFSPYRSIFLFAPPLAAFFFGVSGFAREHTARLVLVLSVVVYMFALYSGWWAWHGGWCWGPRFYLPVMPLLLIPGLIAAGRGGANIKRAVAALAVAGFAVQLGAVCINYTAVYDYWIKIGKLDWAETDIYMFSPITTHWRAMISTSPIQYDLWIVQAARVSKPALAVLAAAVAISAVFAVRGVTKRLSSAGPGEL